MAAALLIVARAPSVPVALIGFIIGLAAIETGPGCPSVGLAPGLIPACLSYIAIRFATDLVSQAGWIADAIGRCGSRYINATRGLNVDLSFTALGGPAVGLAGMYLLWSGRRAGGIGRGVAAVVIPLAWFALLPVVTPEVAAGPDEHVRLWSKLDLDEPDSRQVLGFVRWESGLPAAKAVVFMQCSYNFRRYMRRVETDEHGFFRFVDVPGNEPYFVFVLPGDDNPMRDFEHFGAGFLQREVWRELILHPHRVMGSVPTRRASKGSASAARIGSVPTRHASEGQATESPRLAEIDAPMLHLVRLEGDSERPVWTFRAVGRGQFIVSNVPHGRYRIQVAEDSGRNAVRSLPFDVADGKTETTVQWSP